MSAIALLNHELLLANRDDLEVVVSSTDGSSLELWDRNTGQCLETFDDDLEAAFVVSRI
tara:strand:- start:190 stop:366 length:177 start_codon:yes stop_codon:yes gene_type:complete